MPKASRSIWARYGAAVLSIVAATAIRWLMSYWMPGRSYPFAPIFIAIIFSAWYGGFGPAIATSLLGLASAIVLPNAQAGSGNPVLGISLFIIVSLSIALFGGLIARARERIAKQFDELARQREQLAATLRSIGDAVIVTDADGRVTSLNPVAEKLTGWGAAEARGQSLDNVFRIINEETREPAENPAARVLREGTVIGLANHTLLISKENEERPIDDSAAPVRDAEGRMAGVVLVFRDVTERRHRERQRREAERRKDEFLAVLAHELRNPLAPIASSLEILQLPNIDAKTATEARNVAERQLRHLTRLVDDLLDMSRIMRGKVELRRQRIELTTVVARAIETARPLIEGERHQLTVALPEEPVWLDADLVRLAQVVGNLLCNAAKYTEPGGKIALSAACENGQVVLRVRDSGIGIAPEVLPRLFEMFMQVAPGARRSQGGLGIGLTLAKNLVEMHGGTIEAHSSGSAQGSEFVVRLPVIVCEDEQQPAEGRDEQGAPGQQRRILVVDDNADAAQSLAMLLTLRGHEVQVALGGREALASARSSPPELVFLDIGMPEIDGYEVARQLRAQFDGDTMGLIAVTGWGTEQDRQRSKEAGFDFHLTKPVGLAAVEQVMEKLTAATA